MLTLKEISEKLDLTPLTHELNASENRQVCSAYASDLMSDALTRAPAGALLITALTSMNVVAVAARAGLPAVIITGPEPTENVRLKAIEQSVMLYQTDRSAFEIAGELYELGIRGNNGRPAKPMRVVAPRAAS